MVACPQKKFDFLPAGKGYTIRQCNFLCDDCERRYASGQDEVLVDRHMATQFGQQGLDRHEDGEKPVAVFRTSDLAVYVLPMDAETATADS